MRDQNGPPDDRSPHPADRSAAPVKTTETSKAVATVPVGAGMAVASGETSSSAIAARERAAVEARFLIARSTPRIFQMCRSRLLDSCKRPGFAAKARYAKPVGGKDKFGLSIRFAEEARVLWGNIDVTTMVVFDDETKRIYRVQGVDLETNATDGIDIIVEKFVERRQVKAGMEQVGQPRANTNGELVYKVKATEDDLIIKANNQIAKAKRNVILSLIPADVKEEAEAQIIETQRRGDAEDPQAALKKIVDAFWTVGVTPVQLESVLGHSIAQVNPAELTLLRSYYSALDDGEATWNDIVEMHTAKRPATATAAETKGTTGLKERIQEKKGATAPTTGTAAATPAQPDLGGSDASVPAGVCEFCGANIKAGEKHKPTCEAVK